MLFSILIANYNNGHFFKDCYRSILKQSNKNWEVIIVDDGSEDDSVEIIKEIIKDDRRFNIYLNEENKGCGYAKAKCARMANGEVLGFLDPDDALYPDAIQIMIEAHKKNRETSIITSNYEMVDLEMNFLSQGGHASAIPEGRSYLTHGRGALTHFASFKKSAYSKTKGIDPCMRRAVDQDLYYKMEEQGEHILIDKVLYKYRVHKNSISQNENFWKAENAHFKTKLRAYERRKMNDLNIKNFSNKQIRHLKSDHYMGRLQEIKFEKNKFFDKIYFIWYAFKVAPSNKFKLKVKSFILVLVGKI